MHLLLQPWEILFVVFCGWVNQRQTEIIQFQNAQISALLEKLGKKRLLLNDDPRRLLAVKGKALGGKTLMELATIVMAEPDISVFLTSTYATDYFLVRQPDLNRTTDALNNSGHFVQRLSGITDSCHRSRGNTEGRHSSMHPRPAAGRTGKGMVAGGGSMKQKTIDDQRTGREMPRPVCPACGGQLIEIRAKLQCTRCHIICETCREGGRG